MQITVMIKNKQKLGYLINSWGFLDICCFEYQLCKNQIQNSVIKKNNNNKCVDKKKKKKRKERDCWLLPHLSIWLR